MPHHFADAVVHRENLRLEGIRLRRGWKHYAYAHIGRIMRSSQSDRIFTKHRVLHIIDKVLVIKEDRSRCPIETTLEQLMMIFEPTRIACLDPEPHGCLLTSLPIPPKTANQSTSQ